MKRAPTEKPIVTINGNSNTKGTNGTDHDSNHTSPKGNTGKPNAPSYGVPDALPPAIGMTNVGPLGCTFREAKFCELVAEGATATDAYAAAFNPKDRKAAYDGGARLLKKDRIIEYVAMLQKRLPREVLNDGEHARQFILEKLYAEATDADRAADRLRAVELLGKVDFVGIFRERQVIEQPKRDAAELKAEVKQRLKALLSPDS